MSAGNRTVLVIIDSRKITDRHPADQTVFAALDHFGVAWEVLDGGDYMGFIPDYVAPRALYIIAHDGAAGWLAPETAQQIADAVTAGGAGLVSFDRRLHEWPDALRALLPDDIFQTRTGILRFGPPGFISHGHDEGEELELQEEIAALAFAADARSHTPLSDAQDRTLVTDAQGRSVVISADVGAGRMVLFGTGESIYREGVYGHVRGIDGLMWRSIVWAAAKPFPMRCVPPYVTARIDDCNGTYGAFAYVDAMNRFGIGPNLGLFTDEMGPTDWAAAKRLYDSGGADFSMHAFRDDFYVARADYRPWATLADKPDLSEGGRHTLFEGLSMDHDTGADLPAETVRRNFRRMDEAFAAAGISHWRVLNAHFGEVGWRAVPLFLQRGVDMPCNNSALGQLYSNQPVWRPRPYGIRGSSGRHGLILDRCPQHPAMTFVSISMAHVGKSHMTTDILSGRVPFIGEAERPKIAEAAAAGTANLKLGLDALAYGLLFPHQARNHAISPLDWESIVSGAMSGRVGREWEGALREDVGVICKRLLDSALVRASVDQSGVLRCELVGATDGPSPLTVWENEDDICTRRVVDIAAIDGYAEVEA